MDFFFWIIYSLQELGLIRKPASFMTSICDERGQELIYAGMPITEVFKEEMGIGGVLGLLWFQRRWVQIPKLSIFLYYSCTYKVIYLLVPFCWKSINISHYKNSVLYLCLDCHATPASSLRCVWWWLLTTVLLYLVHTTPLFVLELARISSPAWPLAY